MPGSGFSPGNIIDLIGLLCLCLVLPISLGHGPWDVSDTHLISDKLWRGYWAHLNLREIIDWVEWVRADAISRELNTLRACTFDITDVQVGLRFVQADMKCGRLRASDVPVGVGELRLVNLFGSMQLGRSA